MFPYRAQVFNGYIASPDACQPINITGLALPQRRQQQQQQQQVALFPLPTQMGMPQPFSSTYGNEAINPFSYIPAQPPFAIPPQQQNFFPLSFPSSQFAPPPAVFPPPPPPQLQLQPQQQQQQQGSSAQRSHLVTPAITPPQNRQLTARPNAAAPETSMNPGMQIPAKTVVLPPRRKPGRPTNASKGLLTKRELRSRKTRKRSSALASGAGTPEPVVAPVQQEPPVFDRASSSRLGSASFSGETPLEQQQQQQQEEEVEPVPQKQVARNEDDDTAAMEALMREFLDCDENAETSSPALEEVEPVPEQQVAGNDDDDMAAMMELVLEALDGEEAAETSGPAPEEDDDMDSLFGDG
ncbi:hypothetical protein ACJQWK_07627 [Exserohilum turcicum]